MGAAPQYAPRLCTARAGCHKDHRMRFGPDNVMPRARVYDVESLQEIKPVMSIDTERGVVVVAEQPYRIEGDDIATQELRFDAIHAIQGLEPLPCLFHCYGRLA